MAFLFNSTGTPPDSLGVQGDYTLDTSPAGKFLWGPKGPSSWVGTASNTTGPTGPIGPPTALPTMTSLAGVYGPSVQFAGQTMGTVAQAANSVFYFSGTSISNTFTPQYNSAVVGVQATNFGASQATVYFYLQDLTTNTAAFSWNAGNGIGAGVIDSKSYAPSTWPLIAGHTYQWQGIRASAGATTMIINPTYLVPSGAPSSLSIYPPAVAAANSSVGKAATITTSPAGIPAQTWYYKNANPSWLHMLEVWAAGSGALDPYVTNLTSGGNQFTADNYGYPNLTSTVTRYQFGPFPPSAWPFIAGTGYSTSVYSISGPVTLTTYFAQMTIGQ